jgi:hypothetical protein
MCSSTTRGEQPIRRAHNTGCPPVCHRACISSRELRGCGVKGVPGAIQPGTCQSSTTNSPATGGATCSAPPAATSETASPPAPGTGTSHRVSDLGVPVSSAAIPTAAVAAHSVLVGGEWPPGAGSGIRSDPEPEVSAAGSCDAALMR